MLWLNRILVLILGIKTVQGQFQKLVGILNREIEGRNNFEILTDEEYAGIDSNLLNIIFLAVYTGNTANRLTSVTLAGPNKQKHNVIEKIGSETTAS